MPTGYDAFDDPYAYKGSSTLKNKDSFLPAILMRVTISISKSIQLGQCPDPIMQKSLQRSTPPRNRL